MSRKDIDENPRQDENSGDEKRKEKKRKMTKRR
jgi:hypothetical protein